MGNSYLLDATIITLGLLSACLLVILIVSDVSKERPTEAYTQESSVSEYSDDGDGRDVGQTYIKHNGGIGISMTGNQMTDMALDMAMDD